MLFAYEDAFSQVPPRCTIYRWRKTGHTDQHGSSGCGHSVFSELDSSHSAYLPILMLGRDLGLSLVRLFSNTAKYISQSVIRRRVRIVLMHRLDLLVDVDISNGSTN